MRMSELELLRLLANSDTTIAEDHAAPAPLAVSLVLPFPLSTWNLYVGIGKTMRLSPAGKAYKAQVVEAAGRQYRGRRPMQGRLKVYVEFHAPDQRWRDLHDNFTKAWSDALTEAGVWLDDHLVDDFHIKRAACHQPGYLAVRIERLP
jgi:Holliday junction resolvase RusA-like endonuclease